MKIWIQQQTTSSFYAPLFDAYNEASDILINRKKELDWWSFVCKYKGNGIFRWPLKMIFKLTCESSIRSIATWDWFLCWNDFGWNRIDVHCQWVCLENFEGRVPLSTISKVRSFTSFALQFNRVKN